MLQKPAKNGERHGKKRDGSHHDLDAKPAKQRKSTSSVDFSPPHSPKAVIDFDDALVAHPSGNNRRLSKKKDENVKSPVCCDILDCYWQIVDSVEIPNIGMLFAVWSMSR